MGKPVLLSIIESPGHPDFSQLYAAQGYEQTAFNTTRKAIASLKKKKPDVLVAEFFYGYGNNYAGINISNLDVTLYSLQKYAPETKIIIMVDKRQVQYVRPLDDILPIHSIIVQPVTEDNMLTALT